MIIARMIFSMKMNTNITKIHDNIDKLIVINSIFRGEYLFDASTEF